MPQGKHLARFTIFSLLILNYDHSQSCLSMYTCKQEVYFEKKMHVSFSLSLELAGIEHNVQAGIFVSQIFKTVCTSEQSDQSLNFSSHFLPEHRPSIEERPDCVEGHLCQLLPFAGHILKYNSWILT